MGKVYNQILILEEVVNQSALVKGHRHGAKVKELINEMKVKCVDCDNPDCPCKKYNNLTDQVLRIMSK